MAPKKRFKVDPTQRGIGAFFSVTPQVARQPLVRAEGELSGDEIATATPANFKELDPACSTLKKFMEKQVTLRGFRSLQNLPTERARSLLLKYEGLVAANTDRMKTLLILRAEAEAAEVAEFTTKREEENAAREQQRQQLQDAMEAAQAAGGNEAPFHAPPLVIDVEECMREEAARQALQAEVDRHRKKRVDKGRVWDRSAFAGPARYPRLLRHEVERYASTLDFSDTATHASAAFTTPDGEIALIPSDFEHVAWLRTTLRSNPFLEVRVDGIHCRACREFDTGSGQFRDAVLPWPDVRKRLADRVTTHLGQKRGTHQQHWATWIHRWEQNRRSQRSEVQDGLARATLRRNCVEGILNTQELVFLLHLLTKMCRRNTAKESVAHDQAAAAVFSDEGRAFCGTAFNLTSPTTHDEVLTIMEETTRERLRSAILASPHNALLFDEAKGGKRKSDMYALYVRYLNAQMEATESLWRLAPEPERDASLNWTPAAHIARHVLKMYDIGPTLMERNRALCTDGCPTMSGIRGGVQHYIRGWRSPFAQWLWCQCHCLNIQAVTAATSHAQMESSCTLLSRIFRFFYRGHNISSRRHLLESEMREACSAIDCFGYWRELVLPEVGETRWVSHEGAALTVTKVLRGLRMTMELLRPSLQGTDVELADAFSNPTKLYGIFLLAVVCPILASFSKVMQSPRFCFSQIVALRDHYIERLQVVKEKPSTFPVYNACWEVMRQAGVTDEGGRDLSLAAFESWHSGVGVPYLTELIGSLRVKMSSAAVVQHLAGFDPRSEAFKATISEGEVVGRAVHNGLEKVADWFMSAKQGIPEVCPDFEHHDTFRPKWDDRHKTALLTECSNVCKYIHQQGLQNLEQVLEHFRLGTDAATMYPACAQVLAMTSIMPISTASAERLFSKMRLVDTRLRQLSDEKMCQLVFLGVEAPWDDGGIPLSACSAYVDAYLQKPRRVKYVEMGRFMDCIHTVRLWRERWNADNTRRVSVLVQTDASAPMPIANITETALGW